MHCWFNENEENCWFDVIIDMNNWLNYIEIWIIDSIYMENKIINLIYKNDNYWFNINNSIYNFSEYIYLYQNN